MDLLTAQTFRGGPESLRIIGGVILRVTTLASFMLVAWGVADYFINRRRYFKELEMTHEELKREFREEEGDPQIKAERRAAHHSIAVQALTEQVRRSKVIIVERV